MASRNNILFKFLVNRDDAKEGLDAQAAQVEEFNKKRATAEVRVDAEQAKREIAEVDAGLRTLPKRELVRLQLEGETANLAALEKRLATLQAKQGELAGAGKDTTNITQRIGTLASRLDASRSRAEALAEEFAKLGEAGPGAVDKIVGKLRNWESEAGKVGSKMAGVFGDIAGKIPLVGGLIETVFGGVAKVTENAATDLGGLVSQLPQLAVGLATAAPLVLLLAAGMAALVGSLASALVGVVALGIAFVAALGPIAVLLAIVGTKIKDIITGQIALKDATANLKTATDAQKQAVTQLHQAEQNQSVQRLAALQAQRQALLAVKDAEDQVADDRLNVQNARLQLMQAQLTLASFKQGLAGLGLGPSALDKAAQNVSVGGNFGQTQAGASSLAYWQMLLTYKQDLLGVKTATQGVTDANQQLHDSQNGLLTAEEQWTQYLHKGLRAYQPYQQAINGVITAEQNLKRANDQLRSAELAKAQAIKHGASEASGFIKVWDRFKKTMGVIFGPAEKAVFKGIETALDIMATKMRPLMPAFLQLGKAIGGAFVWWAKMMTKPDNMKLLSGLVKGAAHETWAFAHWFGEVFKLVVEIANDAMPTLVGAVEGWAGKIGSAAGHQQKVKTFIDQAVASTRHWFDVIGSVLTKLESVLGVIGKIIDAGKGFFNVVSAPFRGAWSLGEKIAGYDSPGSPTPAMQAEGAQASAVQRQQIAIWKKDLTTGINQSGTSVGQHITAAFQKWLEQHLTAAGVDYRSLHLAPIPVIPVTPAGQPAATQQHTHHHHYPPGTQQQAEHYSTVLRKRLAATGGGVK